MKPTRLLVPALVALTAALGCSETEVPAQLEALRAVSGGTGTGDPAWTELEASGELSVSGQGRDVHLELAPDGVAVDLHLPGQSDLSSLDGQQVTLTVSRESAPFDERVVVSLTDGSGLAFLASSRPGSHPAVDWGETVAEEEIDGAVWGYTRIAVREDGGTRSLLPGEVAAVTLGGESWRFVPISAYRLEDDSDFELDCILPPDVLGFEMLRVERPAEPESVERPPELPMARAMGCG